MHVSTIAWDAWGESRLALAIGLLGAILAASLLYTAIPLVILIAFAAFFYFIKRPYELLLLMVFLIPFNFVFRLGPIPVAAELLKAFAWISFLVHHNTRKQPFKTSKFNWCFGVLFGLFALSLLRANDLPFSVTQTLRFALNISLCYLVLNLVDSREKVFQIFRVLIFSAFLVACYGFYQFAIQDFGELFWIVNPRFVTSLSHGRDVFWEWRNRITSVLTSEMELGHYFNMCLPVGFVLWLTEGRKRLRSQWLWATAAMLVGLVLTFTLGAWLALLVTTASFILLFEREQRWKTVFAATLVLALVAAVLALSPLYTFLEQKTEGNGPGSLAWDAYTRLASWGLALQTWRSHPMIGIGYGNFPSMTVGNLEFLSQEWTTSGSSPHDVYLYLLSELGLVGLGAMVLIFFRTLRTNFRFRNVPLFGPPLLALAFALTTALVGGVSDDSPLYGPHTSYIVWLFIGVSEALLNLSAVHSGTFG